MLDARVVETPAPPPSSQDSVLNRVRAARQQSQTETEFIRDLDDILTGTSKSMLSVCLSVSLSVALSVLVPRLETPAFSYYVFPSSYSS